MNSANSATSNHCFFHFDPLSLICRYPLISQLRSRALTYNTTLADASLTSQPLTSNTVDLCFEADFFATRFCLSLLPEILSPLLLPFPDTMQV